MDPFILVGITIISIVLNIVLFLVLRLQPLFGEGDLLIDIGGFTFQFNHAIRRAIQHVMTRDERSCINAFAAADLAVVKATNRYRAKPNDATRVRLEKAQTDYATAQVAAQDAYRQAATRWLTSTEGQAWCAERGIVFPSHDE